MSKKASKFQPLASFQSAKGTPLSGVGAVLARVYASRLKPMIRLPKKFDYAGKPAFVAAESELTGGQVRDVNGEVWDACKVGAQYVAIA